MDLEQIPHCLLEFRRKRDDKGGKRALGGLEVQQTPTDMTARAGAGDCFSRRGPIGSRLER